MGGARTVEEVEELELGDGLPKGKLQEPFCGVGMSSDQSPQDGCPGCPYIESEARACTKQKVLPTEES
jgi:hypothetical protein